LAIETASRAWASAGATIKPIELPVTVAELFEAHGVIQGWEAVRALRPEMQRNAQGLSSILRDYLLESDTIRDEAYAAAQALTQHGRPALTDWFKSQCDVWLTPSAPDEAPLGLGRTGSSNFNRVWTLVGNPCVSVPGVRGVSGAPMGVQIIGPPGADCLVLQAAQSLESALESALAS
jgi:Asp-tRNA(Asn)/Glu-tRNA(Gln) amidotransferase A subunit family amidase